MLSLSLIVFDIVLISQKYSSTDMGSFTPLYCVQCHTIEVMEGCLNVYHILDDVISRLGFNDKILIQLVCRSWRSRTKINLRHQKSLVVSCFRRQEFGWTESCSEHPLESFIDNYVCKSYWDLDFWDNLMSLMPSIKIIFFDCRSVDFDETGQDRINMFTVLSLIISRQSNTLECLFLPEYGDGEYDDFVFPPVVLPKLRHVCFWETKNSNMNRLFNCCPSLQVLKCSALNEFDDWSLLPKGLQVLNSYQGSFKGINSLLSSPASETIEEVDYFRLTPEPYNGKIFLPRLREISFSLKAGPNECLQKLHHIVKGSVSIECLELVVLNDDKIYRDNWIPVFQVCSNLTILIIESPPKLSDSDFVIELITQHVKKLKRLILGFAISSSSLSLLSCLSNLEFLKQTIFDRENMFDESSLHDFIQHSFRKKLSYFELSIAHTTFGKFWAVSDSFLEKMSYLIRESNLSMTIDSDQEEELLESREEGMTLLTNLRIYKK